MRYLARFPSRCGRHENVEPDAGSPLKGNPSSVRRPAGIQVIRGGRELCDHVESGTLRWRSHELDALLRQPEEGKPPIRRADVGTSHAVDDPPWHAAKRRDLPDAPLDGSGYRRRKIQDRARVWGPARVLLIDCIAGDLQRCAASNELQ